MTSPRGRLGSALSDRYRIERELGRGGMATVYLAEDLKHERKVAIKVLKPELAAVLGAERFVQEIKTTANLQHPHILPLFDSGEADGFLYYVMPYIEGETLRAKLNREKQVGIEEAVKITTEVADALDYAHRNNVIHRDIKPENILLHDGRPVVADFGIALAVSAAAGGRITETGLSLGTAHYMSPEQATAEKDLTNRSDIYSLGAVLYEMLTGSPPHVGSSAQQIIMRIVTDDVRLVTEVRRSVPPNVAAALARSLEKVAADRFESAGRFAAALRDPHYAHAIGEGMARTTTDQRPQRVTVALIMVAVLLAVGALWGWLRPDAPGPIVKFTVPTINSYMVSFRQPNLALSPDGTTLVFADDGRLSMRRLDEFETVPIPGTEEAISVFFSPDGQSIGFNQGATLKRLSLGGGPPVDIAQNVGVVMGASWGDDGSVVFAPNLGGAGIFRVPAAGGVPEPVTTLVDSLRETAHRWPKMLPGSRHVLYTASGPSAGWDESRLVAHDLDTGERTIVVDQATHGTYVPTGHLLYAQPTGALVAVPFDVKRLTAPGTSVGILPLVQVSAVSGGASYTVSANGVLAFVQDSIWAAQSLRRLSRRGEFLGTIGPRLYGDYATFSPDGERVALTIRSARNDDIYWIDVTTDEAERISTDVVEDETPIWSPDGARLAYTSQASRTSQRSVIVVSEREMVGAPRIQPRAWRGRVGTQRGFRRTRRRRYHGSRGAGRRLFTRWTMVGLRSR